MENPGVVLYSESHLFREPPTILQKVLAPSSFLPFLTDQARRADTVLHELSHMWFGDLGSLSSSSCFLHSSSLPDSS